MPFSLAIICLFGSVAVQALPLKHELARREEQPLVPRRRLSHVDPTGPMYQHDPVNHPFKLVEWAKDGDADLELTADESATFWSPAQFAPNAAVGVSDGSLYP